MQLRKSSNMVSRLGGDKELDVHGRDVPLPGSNMAAVAQRGRQVVGDVNGRGLHVQLQGPCAAPLEPKGQIDGPVYGRAQAVDENRVHPLVHQLLAPRQLSLYIGLVRDVNVTFSSQKSGRQSFAQFVLNIVNFFGFFVAKMYGTGRLLVWLKRHSAIISKFVGHSENDKQIGVTVSKEPRPCISSFRVNGKDLTIKYGRTKKTQQSVNDLLTQE